MSNSSCLLCGQVGERAVWHAVQPDIYVCMVCRSTVQRFGPGGQGLHGRGIGLAPNDPPVVCGEWCQDIHARRAGSAATTEKCPTCGATDPAYRNFSIGNQTGTCDDPFHSAATTEPKDTIERAKWLARGHGTEVAPGIFVDEATRRALEAEECPSCSMCEMVEEDGEHCPLCHDSGSAPTTEEGK